MTRLKFYMRLAKSIVLALGISIMLSSCEKDLEPEVYTRISPDDFPKNADDVKAFVTSSYGPIGRFFATTPTERSEEHTSELQSLMRNSYAVFCLKKKNIQ